MALATVSIVILLTLIYCDCCGAVEGLRKKLRAKLKSTTKEGSNPNPVEMEEGGIVRGL
ncbi:hypothetical protein BDZ91DRAFT_724015 [Kalaharituber pfeilii]|nr:hypothetical protein BDZ91DRAFT_724015 [Kalaharituber pfeilii]